jgi:[1-hydroxy-2-(trimethylamino)ethyl]phosphonate dioxygenase
MSTGDGADGLFDEIVALFAAHGAETYGEGVTMEQHALQTAALARAEAADDALVVAALLHDIGHFIAPADDAFGYHKHDRSGGAWLASRFPAVVSEPVRDHVAAKKYLCAVEPDYFARLSAASKHSLEKQGGPMSAGEAAAFARRAFAERAVRLRRWDDRGKVEGVEVPDLASYRDLVTRLAVV